MPETRKFEPSAGDPIAEALRAALGEQIRPTTPGAPSKPAGLAQGRPGRPPIVPMGSYTFVEVPKPPQAADEDNDEDA